MAVRTLKCAAIRTVVLAGGLFVTGCMEQHLARRDTIAPHGGDTQATNIASQMVDPWPAGSWNKSIQHDGTRMTNTIETYRLPPPPPDQPLAGDGVKVGLTTD